MPGLRPNPTVTELIDYQQFCGIVPETPEEKNVKNGIPQMTVKELKRRIDAGEDVYILDVREPYEYRIAQIGGKLIPQNDVPQRLAEIDREREIIVQCRTGVRSQRIAEFLKQQGYPRVANLAGGILRGARRSTPRCRSTEGFSRLCFKLKKRPFPSGKMPSGACGLDLTVLLPHS